MLANGEVVRYNRHLIMPEVGAPGKDRTRPICSETPSVTDLIDYEQPCGVSVPPEEDGSPWRVGHLG